MTEGFVFLFLTFISNAKKTASRLSFFRSGMCQLLDSGRSFFFSANVR